MKEFDIASGWYWLLIGAVVFYLMGCFHFAVLIAKLKKEDIRSSGSGNPGAMNISRRLGLKYGIINFFCDALKGVIPVIVGYFAFGGYVFKGTEVLVSDFMRYYFAFFAVLGHVFPVFTKFRGGKGISTTIGLLWCSVACDTYWFAFVGLALFLLLFVYVGFTEWGSMGSLMGVAAFSVWQLIIFTLRYAEAGLMSNVYVVLTFMLILALNLLTWGAHHKNLYHLMAGEEHHTSLRKMLKKKKKAE